MGTEDNHYFRYDITLKQDKGCVKNTYSVPGISDDISPVQYMTDLSLVLSLTILPVTPEIASLSQEEFFLHKDPADRLIAATAIHHNAPLITADKKLRELNALTVIW